MVIVVAIMVLRATLLLLILVIFTEPLPEMFSPFKIAAVPTKVLPLLTDKPFVLEPILLVPPNVMVLFPVMTTAELSAGTGNLALASRVVLDDRVIVDTLVVIASKSELVEL